jgi:hypothetical protein
MMAASLYYMMRILKKIICLVLGVTAAGSAFGFSMWGPAETWQVQTLDYGTRYLPYFPPPNLIEFGVAGPGSLDEENTELGGTKNIGEGSRLNVPIITYAYDSSFLNYFGAKGEAAIDAAFTVLNGLPAASGAKLTGFLMQNNQQINYTAQALKMLDLKSTVMWLMMEHMGLIGETHTYDLNERVAVPGSTAACDFEYVVLQRNFDPISYSPSQYVNGTLLTYQIGDLCPAVQVGDAMEQAQQTGAPFSCVATREALQVGGYYLRITRDDMGGLKYLYSKNRYVNEGLDGNATVSAANAASLATTYNPVIITTTNTTTTATSNIFAGLFGGVEKITFVKTPYDSVLGTGYAPRTYHYTMPWVTNGALRTVSVTRTITAPDIIFTAGDLTFPGPDPYQVTLLRTGNFITYGEPVAPGGAVSTVYPAVIAPEMVVTLNNSGQVYYNETGFLDQDNSLELGYIWGSFNGSTNPPIPFPTGTSLEEIEAQVLGAGPEAGLGVFGLGVYNPVLGTNVTTAVP